MWTGMSTDGGNSFIGGIQTDYTNWMINSCPGSGPDAMLVGDSLYTIFMSGAGGMTLVYFSKASVSNMQSGMSIPVTGNFTGLMLQNFPRIANSGNAVGMLWKQSTMGGSQIGMLFTDNILNGFPAAYDTVALSSSSNIENGDVTITNGEVHVVWEDNNSGTVKYRKGTFTPVITSTEAINNSSLSVFPVPVNDVINVRFNHLQDENAMCIIINVFGQEIIHEESMIENNLLQMNLSSLSGGTYFLKIISDKEIFVSKIVKQ
jgi:hypothetical protein